MNQQSMKLAFGTVAAMSLKNMKWLFGNVQLNKREDLTTSVYFQTKDLKQFKDISFSIEGLNY